MKTPEDKLLDSVPFKCAKCSAPMGQCDCWEYCACGWRNEKGERCRNPKCRYSATGEAAEIEAVENWVLSHFAEASQ